MSPMLAILSGPIIAVVAGIIVLAIGVDRLPRLARAMGRLRLNFLQGQEAQAPSPPGEQSAHVITPSNHHAP